MDDGNEKSQEHWGYLLASWVAYCARDFQPVIEGMGKCANRMIFIEVDKNKHLKMIEGIDS